MHTYDNFDVQPNSHYLVSSDDLNELLADHTLMEMDMVTLVDHIDQLTECYRSLTHLNQTISGIVNGADGQLDLHRRRTVKGIQKKVDKLTAQVLDICDSADDALDEMSTRWEFIDMDAVDEDEI